MAGITDQPFRMLCRELGAGLVVSEMVTSNASLFRSRKTKLRIDIGGETEPRVVQIVGADPNMMAEAAKFNVNNNAQVIDINMGCPAKKVCKMMAGSALLKDETLVSKILESVVNAVDVPVTLKIRTGWNKINRNAVRIAKIAEDAGIQALTVHGRSRACGFRGDAEHETAGEIKARVNITVIANGDIKTPEIAEEIIKEYRVDGIMIGRAAQGNPWIFREINHYLKTGEKLALPSPEEIHSIVIKHITRLHEFYGEQLGIRIARKHISWYSRQQKHINTLNCPINQIESASEQISILNNLFDEEQRFAA
jgi:tRNA-dihydrouridine synthase B